MPFANSRDVSNDWPNLVAALYNVEMYENSQLLLEFITMEIKSFSPVTSILWRMYG
jgi:hypothetical protein